MSDTRRLVLPVVDTQVSKPAWLKSEAGAPKQVENLLDRLQPDAEPEPGRAPPRPKERAPVGPSAAAPEPAEETPRRARREMRPEPTTGELERPPPPPRVPRMSSIAAFAPGGRSVVPPAADGFEPRIEARSNAFAEAVTELAIARSSVLATIEGDLLDLALHIAAAIIEREVEKAPELHTVLVRAALRALGDSTHVRLRVSHEAFTALSEHKGGETFDVGGIQVELVPDSAIPGLGCVIDEEHVRVDATVAERLRSVRIAFEDERRRRPGGSE
jgi:hypothetical protein